MFLSIFTIQIYFVCIELNICHVISKIIMKINIIMDLFLESNP